MLHSVNANTSTNVTFINTRPKKVTLYWIDYDGKRVSYGEIDPAGGTQEQQTYVTHPWVVVDSETEVPIGVWNPQTWNSRAIIR